MVDNTSLYLDIIAPLHLLAKVLVLSIACGAISFLITKASIFNPLHFWLEQHSPFFEELFSCPLCTSVWVSLALTLIYHPLLLDQYNRPAWQGMLFTPVDYLVTITVMVALAQVVARVIYSSVKALQN